MEQNDNTVTRKNNTSIAGQQVVMRFFLAINELINQKTIRGMQTFTKKYDIDRRNFKLLEMNPQKKQFDTGWLTYLVRDFGVNAEWLLLGKGAMFTIIRDSKEK